MIISSQQLLHLPVSTQSGQALGKIHALDIDIDSQSIMKYQVKSGHLLQGLGRHELLIHRSQVISISAERMVVEDNVVKETTDKKQEKALTADEAPAGIMSSQGK